MDDDFDIDDNLLLEAANRVDKYLDETKPKPVHIECLQTKFGHNEFRPKQWDIIRTIIDDKRDNCVIMPTGYGKSLCFQFPSVFTNGITLVVSPLISLMQDQVRSLHVANIPACFLGSAQTDRNILSRVYNGEFLLVYISPEYIGCSMGKDLLKNLESKLTLIAIDEAHAISQWGHDFRTDYRKLGEIRKTIPSVPILAVTATATPHVQNDMVSMLGLRNPQVLCMGFDRSNIHFTFRAKGKDTWSDLKSFTTQVRGSVIIYVLKKITSEEIARILRNNGVACEIYHAGLSKKKRTEVLEHFTMDRLQVIVATVAFGMGIDKPDVRCVVHYGASKNLETYYQEVGRAGRDGHPSKAITFYDESDFQLHEWFLNQNHEHKSESVIQHLRDIGGKMKDFCYTSSCRRKFILDYFGSDTSNIMPRKNCCDNCDRGLSSISLSSTYENIDDNGFYDFTQNGYLLLKAMQITGKSSVAISVLRGSGDKKSTEFRREKEIFGAGKIWSKDYWSALIQQLKLNDYFTTKPLPMPYRPLLILSSKGHEWLRMTNRPRLKLKAIPEMYQYFVKKKRIVLNNNVTVQDEPIKPVDPVEPVVVAEVEPEEDLNYSIEVEMSNKHLEEILLGIRTVLAENSDCMPYLVASNTAIQQMVEMKPVSIREFQSCMIDGFSVAKVEKFAPLFIVGIIKFMNDEFTLSKQIRKFPFRNKTSKLTPTSQPKFQRRLNEKCSTATLQKEFNLTEEETIDEIIILIRSGCAIQKSHLFHLAGVDDAIFEFIKNEASDEDLASLDNLNEIKSKFCENTQITVQMLSLVLNYLKVRQLMKSMNVPYFDIEENRLINGKALLDSKYTFDSVNAKPGEIKNENIGRGEGSSSTVKAESSKTTMEISQNVCQSNVFEQVKRFEVKPPPLLSTKENNNPLKQTTLKAVTTKRGSKLEYIDSSDSDGEAAPAPPPKRVLPGWLRSKKP